jgi:translation initiation factor IF-2
LKENHNRLAIGTVIESKVDKGQGVVSTVIVQKGTLRARDFIVAEADYGRIRTMRSTNDNSILKEVTPGMPAIITGLKNSISAGSKFMGFVDEKFAKNFANQKKFQDKQTELKHQNSFSVEDDIKVHNVIIKTDVSGTAEAIKQTLAKVSNEEVVIKIIRSATGEVTKSDIILAKTSNATIYAFNIPVSSNIKNHAKDEKIRILSSKIIYEIIEDAQNIIKGMKAPKYEEKNIGEAQILKIIFVSKYGNIAGCKMESGKITSKSKVKVYRRDKLIHEGILDTLKRGLNDAKLVDGAKEFGCHIKGFDDIKEGDVIKAFEDVLITE